MTSLGAQVRAKLDHPLIDGDSHIVEYMPVFLDFLKDAGGQGVVEQFTGANRGETWYAMSQEERLARRPMRGPWWPLPTKNTLDRCTSMLPKLYYERMGDFGLDFIVLYTTGGFGIISSDKDDLRQAGCHAYNEYVAASYGEYADRMTPAAMIPMHTPEEAIAELEHAKALGLKVALIPSYVRRPITEPGTAALAFAGGGRTNPTWLDSYGIDSEHDYDPFWARCVELGFPIAAHSAGLGFDDRRSMNYMYNHMGHFGAAGEVLAKALLMGGVTRRFPKLRVALLEGGAQNGVRLYVDIFSRWKKRGPAGLENLNPANLDLAEARNLFERYGDERTQAKLDALDTNLIGGIGQSEIPPELRDDFALMGIESDEDLRDLFIPHFYYGCEADDPMACVAFDRRINPLGAQVRAIMSFDLGHWDVTDMSHAAAEAYEQLEDGLIGEEDFRTFGFTNSVRLYAGANPDFFKGTAIETEAAAELAAAPR